MVHPVSRLWNQILIETDTMQKACWENKREQHKVEVGTTKQRRNRHTSRVFRSVSLCAFVLFSIYLIYTIILQVRTQSAFFRRG